MRAYVEDWLGTFDDFRGEVTEFINAADDVIIAVMRISGRAKLSGVETDLDLRRRLHDPGRKDRPGP